MHSSPPRTTLNHDLGAFLNGWGALCDQLASAGVRFSPQSRFPKYVKWLSEHAPGPSDTKWSLSETGVRHVSRASLELLQLDRIVTQLAGDSAWKQKIERLFGGSDFPEHESHSAARDLQTELQFAASARMAGIDVLSDEPDVRLVFRRWHIGVAVKRIRSAGKLVDRIAEGQHQIRQSGLSGIVIVDASRAVIPSTAFFQAVTGTDILDDLKERLTSMMGTFEHQLRTRLKPDPLLVFILFAQCLGIADDATGFSSFGQRINCIMIPRRDPPTHHIDALVEALSSVPL